MKPNECQRNLFVVFLVICFLELHYLVVVTLNLSEVFFFAVLLYAFFTSYMLMCTLKGNFYFGLRVPVIAKIDFLFLCVLMVLFPRFFVLFIR